MPLERGTKNYYSIIQGEHERQFAYEAHTVCDGRGFVLGVEVTAGNIHDSAAWDKVYDEVTHKYNVQFVTMDAGYKTPWIAKKTLDDGKVPILPYTRYSGNKERWGTGCPQINVQLSINLPYGYFL